MTSFNLFPPYGRMVAEYEADIGPKPLPPADWDGAVAWDDWREMIVKILTAVLWPQYDPRDQSWTGPAASFMGELTEADFQLLSELRLVIRKSPEGLVNALDHYALFVLEDRGESREERGAMADRSLDRTLREYLRGKTDDAKINETLASWFLSGLLRKSGSVDLQLKQVLQRPRAYQMAPLLDKGWFTHQHATSAVTPAMISGHCFQGCMGGVAAFYHAKAIGCDASVLEILAQHAVDIGDRRVFAGVHYPSDNLSSWIAALLITPRVCPEGGISGRKFLWRAISEHSAVFMTIRKFMLDNKAGAFAPSLALLEKLGSDPTMDIDAACRWIDARKPPS